MVLGWPWGSLGVALVWLCSPESMPSICLVYGFRVAWGGFRDFRLQDTFARGRVSAHNENCCNLLASRSRLCKTMLMAHKLQRRQFLKLTALRGTMVLPHRPRL